MVQLLQSASPHPIEVLHSRRYAAVCQGQFLSWGYTLHTVFDGLIYALLTAGTFGWLWPWGARVISDCLGSGLAMVHTNKHDIVSLWSIWSVLFTPYDFYVPNGPFSGSLFDGCRRCKAYAR